MGGLGGKAVEEKKLFLFFWIPILRLPSGTAFCFVFVRGSGPQAHPLRESWYAVAFVEANKPTETASVGSLDLTLKRQYSIGTFCHMMTIFQPKLWCSLASVVLESSTDTPIRNVNVLPPPI